MFRTDGIWSTLAGSEPVIGIDPLRGQLGQPGLWKVIAGPEEKSLQRVFELPARVLEVHEEDDDSEEATSPLSACLHWAMQTAEGQPIPGWQPPPRDELEAWIPPYGLAIQTGPIARQGFVICTPERLALRFPVAPSIPPELPAARRAWLRELLLEAQNRWRMVRVGLSDSSVEAEVDLTGAPAVVLEALFRFSLDALRWVVHWLAYPANFLADPTISCRAWESCPLRAEPAERRT
jgi:hypothetical protein